MIVHKTKAVLLYCIIAFLISVAGIVLHFLADHVIENGFMVRHKLTYFTIQTNIFSALFLEYFCWKQSYIIKRMKNGHWDDISCCAWGNRILYHYDDGGLLGNTSQNNRNSFQRFFVAEHSNFTFSDSFINYYRFFSFCPHGYLQKRHASLWLSYTVCYLFLIMLYPKFIQELYYSFQMQNRTI